MIDDGPALKTLNPLNIDKQTHKQTNKQKHIKHTNVERQINWETSRSIKSPRQTDKNTSKYRQTNREKKFYKQVKHISQSDR